MLFCFFYCSNFKSDKCKSTLNVLVFLCEAFIKWWLLLYVFFSYDHPDILAGQGACALEIAEQVQGIDAVVIPVGGGGLIAGCAVAFKALHPGIEVIVSWTFYH